MKQVRSEKLALWYVVLCAIPYAPYLVTLAFPEQGQMDFGFFAAGALFAGTVGVFNLIAGPFLIWRLQGIKKAFVILAFLIGAVFPSDVMVSAFFYQPDRPVHISSGD